MIILVPMMRHLQVLQSFLNYRIRTDCMFLLHFLAMVSDKFACMCGAATLSAPFFRAIVEM